MEKELRLKVISFMARVGAAEELSIFVKKK